MNSIVRNSGSAALSLRRFAVSSTIRPGTAALLHSRSFVQVASARCAGCAASRSAPAAKATLVAQVRAKHNKGSKADAPAAAAPAADPAGDLLRETETLMVRAVDAMKSEFDKLRTGQASASMLDHVKVKAYGGLVPLSQVGQVALRDGNSLIVNVFDTSVSKAIETAIRDCGMNLNPIGEEGLIRVPLPKMTKEFRESLAKTTKTMAENAKVSVRRARQKGMDTLKTAKKSMSADEARKLEKKVQELHDQFIKSIDELMQKKTKAIMQT